MEGIKNILFDMGGVIISLDRMGAVDAFKKLGFDDIETYLGDFRQKGAFLEVEEGDINKEEFFEKIRKHIPAATDAEITDAFMGFVTGLPVEKLQLLRQLKEKGYRVMMLSNTNPVIFPVICEKYFTQEGLTVNDYFEDIFLSYEIKAAKPDPNAFKAVLDISGIKAEETLFIDDSQTNLSTSELFGFKTFLAPQNQDFSYFFESQNF